MSKVEIQTYDDPNSNFGRLKVLVDGKLVAEGRFGGEAEDNCTSRTYYWVDGALAGLARALGAEVSLTELAEDDE